MDKVLIVYIAWLIIASLGAIVVFGIDKKRAEKGKKRIKEKVLFMFIVSGGAVGASIAMPVLRHKNRKMQFVVTTVLAFVLQISVLVIGIIGTTIGF